MEESRSRKIATTLVLIVGLLLLISPTTFAPVDAPAVLLFAASIYAFLLDQNFRRLVLGTESLALIGFAGVVLLSYLFTPTDQSSFAVITLYMVTLYFVGRWIAYQKLTETLLSGYKLGAVVSALLGIVVMLFLQNSSLANMVLVDGRLTMFFSDPNVYGAFLIPALLLCIGTILFRNTTEQRLIAINGCYAVVILLALLFTYSRGAYIAAIVGLLTLFGIHLWQHRSEWKKTVFFILGITGLSILFMFYIAPRDFIEGRLEQSIAPRLETMAFSVQLLEERDPRTLIIGSGNGSYESLSPDGFSAHNTYLRILVENGLLGFGLLVFFATLIMYRFFFMHKDLHRVVIVASLVAILVQSVVIDTLHWRHAFLLLGLL